MILKLEFIVILSMFFFVFYYQNDKIENLLETQRALINTVRLLSEKTAILEDRAALYQIKEKTLSSVQFINFDVNFILYSLSFIALVYCSYNIYSMGVNFPSIIYNFFSVQPKVKNRLIFNFDDTFSNKIKVEYSVLDGENKLGDIFILNKNTGFYEVLGDLSRNFNYTENPLRSIHNVVQKSLSENEKQIVSDIFDNM